MYLQIMHLSVGFNLLEGFAVFQGIGVVLETSISQGQVVYVFAFALGMSSRQILQQCDSLIDLQIWVNILEYINIYLLFWKQLF